MSKVRDAEIGQYRRQCFIGLGGPNLSLHWRIFNRPDKQEFMVLSRAVAVRYDYDTTTTIRLYDFCTVVTVLMTTW